MGLASLAGVHPSHYPYVRNGPACACTHRRVSHVRTDKYGLPKADLGCSECGLCERYTPLEAINRLDEERQRDQILADQARRNEIHRRLTFFQLLAMIVSVPLAFVNPELFWRLLLLIVVAGGVNISVTTYGNWRRGDMEPVEAVIHAGMSLGILWLALALALGASTVAFWLIGVVLIFGFAFGLQAHQQIRRAKRSLDAIMTDLKKHQP